MSDEDVRYYRIGIIPYGKFEEWLGLPPGFKIDGLEHDLASAGLMIRIKCPEEERFQCIPGYQILRILCEQRVLQVKDATENDVILRLSWPELESKEI